MQSAAGPDAITAADECMSGRVGYMITGTVGAKSTYVGGWQDIASAEFVMNSELTPFVATVPLGTPSTAQGSRATVSGSVSVIPEYEYEAFGLPDVRSAWRVLGVKAEDSEIVLDAHGVRTAGRVRAHRELDRMRRWKDEADPNGCIMTSYLVDLGRLCASNLSCRVERYRALMPLSTAVTGETNAAAVRSRK